ncbi:MAG: hypothetical protein RJQ07_05905 [Pseudomonadales bacterium]
MTEAGVAIGILYQVIAGGVLVAALVISISTMREMIRHNRLSVKPIIKTEKTDGCFYLRNDGVGPAIINSIHLFFCNQEFDLSDLNSIHVLELTIVAKAKGKVDWSTNHIASKPVIPPGQRFEVLALNGVTRGSELAAYFTQAEVAWTIEDIYGNKQRSVRQTK